MVDLYASLIIKKKRKFSQVPKSLQPDVEAELLRRGYDTNGDPIPLAAEDGLTTEY